MKKYLRYIFFLVFSVAMFVLGYFTGIFYGEYRHDDTEEEVFEALTRIANTKITHNLNTCPGKSVLGNDEILHESDVTVGYFISQYLTWTFKHEFRGYKTISCKGENIQQCEWIFGKHGGEEDFWNAHLKFEYNQKSQTINPKSLKCEKWP